LQAGTRIWPNWRASSGRDSCRIVRKARAPDGYLAPITSSTRCVLALVSGILGGPYFLYQLIELQGFGLSDCRRIPFPGAGVAWYHGGIPERGVECKHHGTSAYVNG